MKNAIYFTSLGGIFSGVFLREGGNASFFLFDEDNVFITKNHMTYAKHSIVMNKSSLYESLVKYYLLLTFHLSL